MDVPRVLAKMDRIFAEAGFEAYLVGGAVRDTLLGARASDYDIATNAEPQDVIRLFRRVIPTGIQHGTVTVLFMGHRIEVTTFRSESGYTDSRHPDAVSFRGDIEDDLSRRDFTMNAIAVSLKTGEIIDPFGGQGDIRRRLIRTVGSPYARFTEDALRPIRAIRFSACLGFDIDMPTLEAIPLSVPWIGQVSVERFRDELVKLLGAGEPSGALGLLENCGILRIFIPELAACRGVGQGDGRGFHQFDVLDHLYYSCDGAPRDNLNVRLAALFHDIAKPLTKKTRRKDGEDLVTFYNHERLGADMTLRILTRLRFPQKTARYAARLVGEHMFHYESSWSGGAVRRFLTRVTPEAVDDLFSLRLADVYGMTRRAPVLGGNPWSDTLVEFRDRIEGALARRDALSLKDLAVNGDDLIKAGIPPGRVLGEVLRSLFETILDDPAENTPEKLLPLGLNYYRKYQ
jgi:putative nucleotidyltransferase with HDIG domain